MPHLLDQDTIELLQSREVALCVAACDTQRRSHSSRAFCCKVSADGRRITTWITSNANAALLASINSNGRLALVVCHIQSLRSLQLKSIDARVAPIDSDDYAYLLAYQQGFVTKAVSMGYPEDVMRTYLQFRFDQLYAIEFTPDAAYIQTPGPQAGVAVATVMAST